MPISIEVWLGQLERALRVRVDDIEIIHGEPGTVTFSLGFQGATVHAVGDEIHIRPSLDKGGMVAEEQHLYERATYLKPTTYALDGATVISATVQIASHLTGELPKVEREPTLAEIYAMTDRLNGLTGHLNPAQSTAQQRFLSVRYQGRPFGEWVPVRRNSDPTEIEYAKEFGEGVAFAHLAVAANFDDQVTNIESRQPPEPDLRFELTDGSHVWVEVAQVTENASTRYFAAIRAVNQHLMRKERSDPAYLAEVQGRHVAVMLTYVPPKNRSREAADEIVALLRSIDFDTVQRKAFIAMPAGTTPYLASLNAKYYVAEGISTHVRATNGANSFDPNDGAEDFDTILATKTKKTYSVDAPLWLALYLNDLQQVPHLTMDAIRKRQFPGTGQFERVIVGTLVDAEVIGKND